MHMHTWYQDRYCTLNFNEGTSNNNNIYYIIKIYVLSLPTPQEFINVPFEGCKLQRSKWYNFTPCSLNNKIKITFLVFSHTLVLPSLLSTSFSSFFFFFFFFPPCLLLRKTRRIVASHGFVGLDDADNDTKDTQRRCKNFHHQDLHKQTAVLRVRCGCRRRRVDIVPNRSSFINTTQNKSTIQPRNTQYK